MSTNIEWCDETINPIVGCTQISIGCDNCYAKGMAYRLVHMPHTAERYAGVVDKDGWTGKLNFVSSELEKPGRWKKPRRIFVGSMTDLFHHQVRIEWLDKIMEMIRKNQRHTFIFLTKRADNMNRELMERYQSRLKDGCFNNLWLGVTIESYDQIKRLKPLLSMDIPNKRLVSVEPMLGPAYGLPFLEGPGCAKISWVICGAETGKGARPMDIQWARDLRDECSFEKVPFFMKKITGGVQPPPDLLIRQYLIE